MIIDGHLDLAWNAITLKRQLTDEILSIRNSEKPEPWHHEGTSMVSFPEMHKGNINIVFATIFAQPFGSTPTAQAGYKTADEAYNIALQQIKWYEDMENIGKIKVIRSSKGLEQINSGILNVVLLMEGADPLRTVDDLDEFIEYGIRAIGPAWRMTRYAGGAGAPGPLTECGRQLLKKMSDKNIGLDLSHLSDLAMKEALKIHTGPVFASHSNCRTITMKNIEIKKDSMMEKIAERQLDDFTIEQIASRNGVIGLVMYNPFISAGWNVGDELLPLSSLLPHINHIKKIAGFSTIAIGSDLDGGVSLENTPQELNTIADLNKISELLKENNFSDNDVEAVNS